MPREEFEKYSTQLFDEWVAHVDGILELPDYSLSLQIEEGSVKGAGKIAVVLGALYIGIGNYGSFVSGLQTIRSQVSSVGDFLAERATQPFGPHGQEAKVKKRGGTLAHLQRLFNKVQRREMTAEEAIREAELLLGEDADANPEFMHQLENSLRETRLFPEQLPLLDTTEIDSELLPDEKPRRARLPRQLPTVPPPQQFRVEVWRDSKNGRRKVRVVQL